MHSLKIASSSSWRRTSGSVERSITRSTSITDRSQLPALAVIMKQLVASPAMATGCEPTDIGKTIHPHATLGESIGMTAEVFEGHCTDLPPQKKK